VFDVSQVKTEGIETLELDDDDCDDETVEEVVDEDTDDTLELDEVELEV
jgi:hypothetical protein